MTARPRGPARPDLDISTSTPARPRNHRSAPTDIPAHSSTDITSNDIADTTDITTTAARHLADLATRLHARGHRPARVAAFLLRLALCLLDDPAATAAQPLSVRFAGMLRPGRPGAELFLRARPLPLPDAERHALCTFPWHRVEPVLLTTLFERALHPRERHRHGAHYTAPEAILRILDPVMLAPLRRELADAQNQVLSLQRTDAPDPAAPYHAFLARLRTIRVLDPACGAGNFLYLALRALLDLESTAIAWAHERLALPIAAPSLGPQSIRGLERDPHAAALARAVVSLTDQRWRREHGHPPRQVPVAIAATDALLDRSTTPPRPTPWPVAEFIVGNPPFLGAKKLRAALGDAYVDTLFAAWSGQVPQSADLSAYWHERARAEIADRRCRRAALLATQGIRAGANHRVLARIARTGAIFLAWSDLPWIVDGAAVRVSLVGQDDGSDKLRLLDGRPVPEIQPDLRAGPREPAPQRLRENLGLAFMGDTKGGPFELAPAAAARMLATPGNRAVLRPWVNGRDITGRPRGMHIIDFDGLDQAAAARHPEPYAHAQAHVRPVRARSRSTAAAWWSHERPRPEMRAAISELPRYLVTPTASRHRIFVWLTPPTLPDHQLIVIARADAYAFGVLHARPHELWSLRMCSRLGVGNDPRYTPTTTFETFPFPWPPTLATTDLDPAQRRHHANISAAADDLDRARREHLASEARRTLTGLYNERPAWLRAAHQRLDHAVLAAHGWSPSLGDDELLAALLAENHRRA